MNKVLIIDTSASYGRIMSGLLTRARYDPVSVGSIEAGKVEVVREPVDHCCDQHLVSDDLVPPVEG